MQIYHASCVHHTTHLPLPHRNNLQQVHRKTQIWPKIPPKVVQQRNFATYLAHDKGGMFVAVEKAEAFR